MLGYTDASGNFVPANNTNGSGTGVGGGISNSGGACDTTGAGSTLPQMNDQDKANLFNPYKQNTAMDLLNKLMGCDEFFYHIHKSGNICKLRKENSLEWLFFSEPKMVANE